MVQSISHSEEIKKNIILSVENSMQNKNPLNSIHPLIFALFFGKIKELDERMIHANISGVVTARYNKTPIVTKPDYELLYNLVNDPADAICFNESPMKDLMYRTII